MNTDRIKEIQQETAYPESVSVQQALLKVWNETEQEQLRISAVRYQLAISALEAIVDPIGHMKKQLKEDERLDGMYAIRIAEGLNFIRTLLKRHWKKLPIVPNFLYPHLL